MPTILPDKKKGQRHVTPCFSVDTGSLVVPNYNFTYARDVEPLPASSESKNIRYSRNGFAWTGVRLDVLASACPPRTLNALAKEAPLTVDYWIDQGTIIGSVHPMTYGDWILEHVSALARSTEFPRPLVLPKFMQSRPYVINELSALGIEPIFPNRAIGIRKSTVLHKIHNGTLLLADDVKRMRRLFGTSEIKPANNSIIFLSRSGVATNNGLALRDYQSERTERIVTDFGGHVCRTKEMSTNDYARVAALADIVIADHGAAIFNILHWRSKALIELVTHDWWLNCFCFLSSACGVEYHGVIDLTGKSEDNLRHAISSHIAYASIAPPRDHACAFPYDVYVAARRDFLANTLS